MSLTTFGKLLPATFLQAKSKIKLNKVNINAQSQYSGNNQSLKGVFLIVSYKIYTDYLTKLYRLPHVRSNCSRSKLHTVCKV